ncbi:sodium/proline symporter [Mediterraneibacter agrestimuris]|uniref:sodium/proline symporter n=1 Tax=Mediterraneibacter agrestimuris TaxID=2941333 RepID=UPI00203D54CE|nr:sodium/proline symporter [Mediterraneibacter agrestimuris]
MDSRTWGIFGVIIIYLLGMVAIGVYYMKKNSSAGDYYLGGRGLGPFVTAMSAEASDMSSWLLMGLPGVAYLTGVADAAWTAIGLAIGTYLNWLIVAKRLRRYTEISNNSITIPGFFSNRYRDKSKLLVAISAIFIVIFFIPYTASGFAACGKLFSTLFHVPYAQAMVVSAIVIVAYTTLGGFSAASMTDLIQSIVMTGALICVVLFGISTVGGADVVMNDAGELPGYLSLTQSYVDGAAAEYGTIKIASMLAWGLGYFGMPHVLLRFMAIRDENEVKISRRIASVWVVISMGVAIFIGLMGHSMTENGIIDTLTGADSEKLIIMVGTLMSKTGAVGVIIAGLIMSGILACTMSTADSQLLAASSSVSEDLLKGVFHLNLNEKWSLVAARITVVVISIMGVLMAIDPNSSVFGIVSFAWAGFGAVFGPVMLLALFWKRSNRYGAMVSMLSGGTMIFVWKYLVRPMGGAWDIYELLPAFLVAITLNVIVSLATGAPEREIIEEFNKAVGK